MEKEPRKFKFMIMSKSIKIQLMFHRNRLDIFIGSWFIDFMEFSLSWASQTRQHQQMFDCNFSSCAVNLDSAAVLSDVCSSRAFYVNFILSTFNVS